jgi:hypothetical protein
VHSSITRSQLTSRFVSWICSFASICQVSWGEVARPASARGFRPAGAGDRSARANQRWSVRSVGTGRPGVSRSNWTRISSAPQVGCSRRRSMAACTAPGGVTPSSSRHDGTSEVSGRRSRPAVGERRRSRAPCVPAASVGRSVREPVQEVDAAWSYLRATRPRSQSSNSVPMLRNSQTSCRD